MGGGRGMGVTRHNRPDQDGSQYFKPLLWVVRLTHPVYFISVFVILTHS